jgi:hypothetical protein
MITLISSVHTSEPASDRTSDVRQAAHPPAPKPDPEAQTPQSGALSGDQVTLKSAGQVDHDGGR